MPPCARPRYQAKKPRNMLTMLAFGKPGPRRDRCREHAVVDGECRRYGDQRGGDDKGPADDLQAPQRAGEPTPFCVADGGGDRPRAPAAHRRDAVRRHLATARSRRRRRCRRLAHAQNTRDGRASCAIRAPAIAVASGRGRSRPRHALQARAHRPGREEGKVDHDAAGDEREPRQQRASWPRERCTRGRSRPGCCDDRPAQADEHRVERRHCEPGRRQGQADARHAQKPEQIPAAEIFRHRGRMPGRKSTGQGPWADSGATVPVSPVDGGRRASPLGCG